MVRLFTTFRTGIVIPVLVFLTIAMIGCNQQASDSNTSTGPVILVLPENGAYTGAYIDFGLQEDSVTLDSIEDFEKLVGKHQAVIASSNFWGEQNFPSRNLLVISRHNALPLIYWSPWDRPYKEETGPDRFSLKLIIEGKYDDYIDRWAESARDYGKPLLVSWGLEMNGNWFPWSGYFYGAGETTTLQDGSIGHVGPELYKEAFRYVVNRVRSRGASNILWGFHVNGVSYPEEQWNAIALYYPGSEYVDWLGMSAYGKQFDEADWVSFQEVMDSAYNELCALDPVKPLIVAEWGVSDYPTGADKPGWLRDGFAAFTTKYPRIKAAVYWHERWMNGDETYTNLRVNSTPESLEAYRGGIADPYWIDRPIYVSEPAR